MNFKKIMLFAIVVLGMSACGTTYRITSDYEKGVNFSAFKTYQILKRKNDFPYGMNPINQQRIERAIQFEMANLGYEVAQEPDMIIAYFVKEKNIREVNHYYRSYYGRWGFPVWVDVNEYKEGTLIIDLINRENKQVVWHGAAKGSIYDGMSNIEEKINEVVEELFEQFVEDANKSSSIAINN